MGDLFMDNHLAFPGVSLKIHMADPQIAQLLQGNRGPRPVRLPPDPLYHFTVQCLGRKPFLKRVNVYNL